MNMIEAKLGGPRYSTRRANADAYLCRNKRLAVMSLKGQYTTRKYT